MFETGEGFDWATAEALAFGSLLLEGNADICLVRIGTRHLLLYPRFSLIRKAKEVPPLLNLRFRASPYEVINSPYQSQRLGLVWLQPG